VDGILGFHRAFFHNLFFFSQWNSGYQEALHTNYFLFSRWNSGYQGAFSHELFSFFHGGILAIRKPFTRTFLFSRWNSGYQGAFHTNFSFTMEFWLSGSLSHELFFFHDGILAIKEPFSRTFSFFTMEFWLSRSLSHELFSFFHDGILAIRKPFSRTFFFFHDGILEMHDLGENFFHIYITKSIYMGSALLKTLPLDLEPPLQGKEYRPPYSNATKKRKAIIFSRSHL
jgi:hypothetical protein